MVVNRPLDDQPPPEDPIDGFSLDADQRQPTMTLAGWRRFVETPPPTSSCCQRSAGWP
jgi:hypothetical protein